MDFSRNDYLSADNMLASVVRLCQDPETKKIPKGRYVSLLHRALQELSFDTFFNIKRFDEPVPECLYFDMPAGTFSVKEVYVYNGEVCNIRTAQKLWYKPNYYTRGNGFFAKNRGNNNIIDPFYPSNSDMVRDPRTQEMVRVPDVSDGLLWYNVENGQMMVSPAAKNYQKIHVVAHGTICPFGEAPLIPPYFQEAVEDFVCEFATRELIGVDGQLYLVMNREYQRRLDYHGYNGSWHKAKTRIKNMSKGERADFYEYLQRWSW